MYRRNNFRFTNLAVAFCFLLAFTVFATGSRYAEAQTPIVVQSNQAPAMTDPGVPLAVFTPQKVHDGTAVRISHYNPDQMLRLVLTVHPPHMAEEEQFIKELVTKGSPNFHKFLTPDEWNARFAPSVEDEQAVVDWAQSVGLTVTKRYPNRLIVDVEGTAGTIEKAFGVTINNYQVGDEVDFSNDRDPIIPANLTGIMTFVTGLSNIERPHRIGSRFATKKGADYVPGPMISDAGSSQGNGDPTKAPAARAAAAHLSGSPSQPHANDNYPLDDKSGTYAMDPDNIQSSNAYDYNALQRLSHCCNEPGDSTGSPPESSIALVGYGGFLVSDITTFFNAYGMAWNINWYCIAGTGGGSCPGNDGEAPLDVEYSGAMSNSYGSANDTAHIYEYEMTNNLYTTYEDAWEDVGSDGYAKVASTSYGWEENVGFSGSVATGTMHPIFNTLIGEGVTLIAASGDNGASDGCGASTAVDYPSSDPDFIAAGGTQLNMYTDGIFYSETAWQGEFWSGACGSNHGGSTGGRSVLFGAPSWQSSTTNSTYPTGVESPYYEWQTVSGTTTEYIVTGNTNRLVPDISLTANPDVLGEWYVSGGTWQDEGGTSIVGPELAGFFAQENSYLDSIGSICGSGSSACAPVGLATPYFYYNAIDGAPHNPFYDMTSGCNDNDITVADDLFYFCAYAGYDPITGWGSANMMQLAWGINWEIIPADGTPSLSFGGPTINTWYNSDQIVDWDLSDGTSNGYTAPGAVGFTLGWDSIPSDSYSEPHGGDGDTFYTGAQYLSTFGCVDNNGSLCEAASGQGCHTVYVRGWDNQGNTTNGSYGPVCYDSVPPTIAIDTAPAAPASTGWFNIATGGPTVSLVATDPGGSDASGVKTIYGVVGATTCSPTNLGSCQIYGPPFGMPQGATPITTFSEDNAGNFSNVLVETLYVDTVAPATSVSLSGTLSSGIYTSAVTVQLTATDATSGVKTTYYKLNGGATTVYSAPFTVSTLGSNTVQYWSVDNAGNTGTTNSTTFTIHSPTTATLVATPNPSLLGGSVKMTATVTATISGTPTGTVTFYNGATNLGTGTLSGGVATLSTTALPAGALTLQVSYPATGNFLATNSAPFDETVNENTTTKVTSSLNPSVYGQSVTFTAQVAPSSSGTPTGSVSFYVGGILLGTETLNSSDMASITTSSLTGGTNSITAVYSGDSTYLTSTSGVLSESVTKAAQTITFPTVAAQTALTTVTLTATASSGLPITYSSVSPTVCTVSGDTATLLEGGYCGIEATQSGNSDYSAAPDKGQNIQVLKAPQTITFPAIGSQPALSTITLSATASSGLTVSFSSLTPTICTVSGDSASLLKPGTCTIRAAQAGNIVYAGAADTQSFAVDYVAQTITFPTIAAQTALTTVTLTATASSGLPITYSSVSPTVCTVSGDTATLLEAGYCGIEATQSGNSDYSAAPDKGQNIQVLKAPQTITFPTIGSQPALSTITLSATASSGLTVSFSSLTPTICTVSGDSASLLKQGTCTIRADQAGNIVYAGVADIQSFTVTAN